MNNWAKPRVNIRRFANGATTGPHRSAPQFLDRCRLAAVQNHAADGEHWALLLKRQAPVEVSGQQFGRHQGAYVVCDQYYHAVIE